MKRFLLFITFFFLFTTSVFADSKSTYVLPYPSGMPGSIFYKPRLLWDEVLKYWYFGNFGQFKYNLKESDKYLVEAKTLFEYSQFLNAHFALAKSDKYFKEVFPYLLKAKDEGKDVTENRRILQSAAQKHIEVLNKLLKELPEEVNWRPEKASPIKIYIGKEIRNSLSEREKYL